MTDSLLNIQDDLDTTETLVAAAFELAEARRATSSRYRPCST